MDILFWLLQLLSIVSMLLAQPSDTTQVVVLSPAKSIRRVILEIVVSHVQLPPLALISKQGGKHICKFWQLKQEDALWREH